MHDKDLARMRNCEDVPDAQVAAIRAPTLIVLGDRDVVRPEHGFELTKLIPGSRLLILPGGHGDYLGEADATPAGSSTRIHINPILSSALDKQISMEGYLKKAKRIAFDKFVWNSRKT